MQLLRNTPATLSFQADVNENRKLSLYYSGSIKGALNKISRVTGYQYIIRGNRVIWNAFVTKVFDISLVTTTRVTVTDTPDNVYAIQKYIEHLNSQ